MRTSLHVHVHVCATPDGEVHPQPLPEHRILRSCEAVHGYPRCYGCANDGPAGCYCEDTLTPEQHAQCVADAWAAFEARGGEMCADCAFRKGSPEADMLDKIASSREPFRCHQGMPVDTRPGYPVRDAYCPRQAERGAPDYPVCAGWQRAHAALARGGREGGT
jgi:hypothetical protein